jgi:FkbM family methyltransferase
MSEIPMNFQTEVAEFLNSTPIGRIAYQAARRTLHLGRKIAHPRTPSSLGVCKITCRGKRCVIFHRRTYADKLAIRQCFRQEQYDMPEREHGVLTERLYQQIVALGKQPLIVDCGANIGASVLWFTARYPKAHVLAVEPAPDNFAMLQRNCDGLDVDLRRAAIGGTDSLAHLADSGWGTLAYRATLEGQGPEVAMLTVATLLASKPDRQYVPFILKIDIEGGEQSLFESDCSSINRFPLIILEPHDWLFPGEGSSLPFFRFHAASGREFSVKHENIASIDFHNGLSPMAGDAPAATTGQRNDSVPQPARSPQTNTEA